ncbi:envelope integrity protein Cei [Pseudonocardia nigra]|uniref:envelope integrity protein Cei n=1 Tax=Pseudonocardia nigra TaxID=1921578 RepID=UPI001C5EF6A6|nr:envelope integrity protein Cei [Pseudonocardia nigra]
MTSDTTSRRVRPYQRRRRDPVMAVVAVLAVVAVATWTVVLLNATGPAGTMSCPAPVGGPPPPGEVLALDALDTVPPVPPDAVRVRVFNAGGQRGQANLVAAQLGDLGFAEAAPPANDPFYPEENLECVGQLRFGPAGERAASTLALVLPCAELVRDAREDDTVDVSVGTAFGDFNPMRAALDALDQLSAPGGGSDGSANADPEAADAPAPQQQPTVDPAVLEEARTGVC